MSGSLRNVFILNRRNMIKFQIKVDPIFVNYSTNISDSKNSTEHVNNLGNSFKTKLNEIMKIYEEISGMSEVREAQRKVVSIQDEMKITQDMRRDKLLELSDIRKTLQALHNDIINNGKGHSLYLDWVKREIMLMGEESEKEKLFQIIDAKERELFSHLTAAIRKSHEKERAQAESTKYFSLVGSLIGAILGIFGSALSYHFRNNQYKMILSNIDKTLDKVGYVENKLGEVQTDVRKLVNTTETWSQYFVRKTKNLYYYIIPKSTFTNSE